MQLLTVYKVESNFSRQVKTFNVLSMAEYFSYMVTTEIFQSYLSSCIKQN